MGKGRERFVAEADKKTMVWWDVNTCPIPDDVNPLHIRPKIESALVKKMKPDFDFENPQVTIIAIGNLLRVTPRHNIALSASGIIMRHAHFDLSDVANEISMWKNDNPPPATIMFITNNPWAEHSFRNLLPDFIEGRTYTVLPAYRGNACGWDSLMKETPDLNTPSKFLVDSNQPPWCCTLCDFKSGNYREFAEHLYGDYHDEKLSKAITNPVEGIYQDFLDDKTAMTLKRILKILKAMSELDENGEEKKKTKKKSRKQRAKKTQVDLADD